MILLQFLSMKLATVNPEINLDIEQIFTKEVRSINFDGAKKWSSFVDVLLMCLSLPSQNLHSRYGSSSALGYCSQIGTSHPQLQGMAIPSLPNSRDLLRTATNSQVPPLAQVVNRFLTLRFIFRQLCLFVSITAKCRYQLHGMMNFTMLFKWVSFRTFLTTERSWMVRVKPLCFGF